MKATDQIKRAAMMKTVDYLLAEKNICNIMNMLDKVAPADVFPTQRETFKKVIAEKNNWYELIMKIFDLNPEFRNEFLKNFIVDGNLMAWPKLEEMREKHQCNIPWDFSSFMAFTMLWYVPAPRRASVVSSEPSALMAGTKFFTRRTSWQNSSSISVALVKHRNAQSGCASHRRMRSFLRTMGSPPV